MRTRQLALLAGVSVFLGSISSLAVSDGHRAFGRDKRGGVTPDRERVFASSLTVPDLQSSSTLSNNAFPLTVDGSSAPEHIPDRVAYRHFILSAVALSSGGAAASVRQRAVLNKLRLSTEDRAALSQKLVSIASQMEQLSEITDPTSRKLERSAVLDQAREELFSGLSPAGVAQLDDYVQNDVKRGIKVYGEIPR